MKKTAIIMAGGFGERFWPLSRMNRPKQVLNLTREDMNMMQESISRISSLIAPEDIFVITSEALLKPIRESIPMVPPQNIIAEPAKRNTAPCLALASAVISARYPHLKSDEIVTAVLTADHKIEPADKFITVVDSALNFVYSSGSLATIGIKPDRPETGYGYIEVSENISGKINKVKSFREKPDYDSAVKYVNSGKFYWNSGMFFWKLSSFNSQMIEFYPEIGNKIDELSGLFKNCNSQALDTANPLAKELFERLPSISIDYALMEKSNNVVCVESDFKWDDVGAWDSLHRVRSSDDKGNIISGNNLLIDSKNCIFVNDNSENQTVTGVCLEDLIVITTSDSIMICPKNKAQDVKRIVQMLKDSGRTDLL